MFTESEGFEPHADDDVGYVLVNEDDLSCDSYTSNPGDPCTSLEQKNSLKQKICNFFSSKKNR